MIQLKQILFIYNYKVFLFSDNNSLPDHHADHALKGTLLSL